MLGLRKGGKMDNELTLQVIEAYSIPFIRALQRNGGIQLKNAIKEKKEKEIKEFILAHYAFERNVSVGYFKWQAIELLNLYWNSGKPDDKKIWCEFKRHAPKLKNDKPKNGVVIRKKGEPMVNKDRNPLNPDKFPIWKINFIDGIINNLNSKSGVENAYKNLLEVQGFGKKITPFILRDLVILLKKKYIQIIKEEEERETYYFLQPIDSWLQLVCDKLELKASTRKKVSGINFDRTIVGICDTCIQFEVNPLKFNQGAWYVGARVMRCRPQFEQILAIKDDFERAKNLVKSGIERDRLDAYNKRDLIKDADLKEQFREEIKSIEPRLLKYDKE